MQRGDGGPQEVNGVSEVSVHDDVNKAVQPSASDVRGELSLEGNPDPEGKVRKEIKGGKGGGGRGKKQTSSWWSSGGFCGAR